MEEKYECAICEKEMKEKELGWSWGGEDAHKKCVLDDSDVFCKKCLYFTIVDADACFECGGKLKDLTPKLKQYYLKRKEPE